ncbi:MAG: Calx-beta domain-containing protein, partial [Eubacteriales bacterium]
MKHKWLQRLTAMLLTLALSVQIVSPALASVIHEQNGNITIVDADGNVLESKSQDEWEEAYPYGVFAFKETQVNLKEGDTDGNEKGTLTLYRLGGTEGRADALVVLVPAAAQIEEDRMSYANAAGTNDYRVTVEDPWPIAQYQAYGGTGEIIRAGGAITTITETPDDDEGGLTTQTLVAPAEDADSYQWQMQIKLYGSYVQRWSDINGATGAEMVMSPELLNRIADENYTYDFRCFYEVNGVKYCSESWQGEAYEPEADYIPPIMPDDFVDDHTRTDSVIEFEGEEYDNYTFLVVFADGEWEKEITFEALDDDLHECAEVVNVVVMESRGAEVYSNACTASVAIEDDEEEIPSAMGFAETEIWADKAAGSVRIPLMRESDGLQYVTAADYTTEDGTAVAGTDYAINTGTAVFPSDLDYTYIEIDLVNDGIPLTQEDSELSFTVKLTEAKGGGGSTLIEGMDTVTVRLYNSCEGSGEENLATALYSPDEVDLTGAVADTSAIVPAGGSVTASYVAPAADIQGEYIADGIADSGISPFTFTYPGVLTFSGAHGLGYWTDYALLANENLTKFKSYNPITIAVSPDGLENSDDLENYVTNAGSLWSTGYRVGNTGWGFTTQKGGTMVMNIPNLYDRYSSVTVNTYNRSERSAKGWYGADDWSYPEFTVTGDNGYVMLHDNAGSNTWEFHAVTLSTGYDGLAEKYSTQLKFLQHYTGSGFEGDASCTIQLLAGFMARRTINLPIVRIYTADDDYLQENAASLHETIKPVISLSAGNGGTTYDGSKLYNNSLVLVSRGDNASSYTFASQYNGGLSNKSLFFSTEDASNKYLYPNDKNENITSNVTSGGGSMRLLMTAKDANKNVQGYVNVVMDREQTFSMEIAPSVPRLSEDDKTTIDPDKIAETWDDFWNKVAANGGATYTYREVNWDFSNGNDGFSDPKEGILTKDMFGSENNGSLYESPALKNVRSINFNLNEDDLILINGIAYAGNEDIPISANLFLNDNITLYYYDADYVTSENTMLATISRIERYIDLNDDGVVNGYINPTTGEFVPADDEYAYSEESGVGTYYVLPSLTDSDYSITDLAPRLGADGEYHQIVLKVYYSMLPRCLVVPAGASDADTAEVIPAFVTAVTSASVRSSMSDEQLGYRYIDHGGTGSGKLMYGAAASVISTVDIPLGGDFSPATVEGENVTWNPDWSGNPYPGTEFTDPQPIYLDGTVLGDHYAVGDVTSDGNLTDEGKERVANYLSSLEENDTFTLCVRETPVSSASNYGLRSAPVQYMEGVESSRLSNTSTYPSSAGVRNLTSAGEKDAGFDSSAANSPMSEYDMGGEINLPELELGITDFVSISTNGLEMAISVGFNLFNVGMENDFTNQEDHSFQPAEANALKDANEEAIDGVKNAWNSLFGTKNAQTGHKEGGYYDAIGECLDKLQDARWGTGNPDDGTGYDGTIISKGFEVSIAINFTLLLKWDAIENRFFFNQMMVIVAASLEFSYTVYLTPCPIFFCCVTVGFGIEIATGLEASRVKVMGDDVNLTTYLKDNDGAYVPDSGWSYLTDQEHMGYDELDEPEENDFIMGSPGSSFTYTTDEKAIDIYFSGTLYVEAVGDQPEGFSPGTIRSAGDEAVTVKLAKKVDGNNNNQSYKLKFTVVDDGKFRYVNGNGDYYRLETSGCALVDRIVEIDRQTHDVYFAGISFSPEASLEISLGMGIEILKVELFINVSVGCSFAVLAHDSADYAGEEATNSKFVFNEFSMAAGVGIRVVALLFKFEFNAVQFTVTYDREIKYDEDTNKKSGWNFMWYAANRQIGSYSLRDGEDDDILKVNIILPGEMPRDEAVFRPEDNMDLGITPFAFNPSDNTVPFQYSGYGRTGDAFTLGSDLVSGSTYELVTANGSNYIVYTVTDQYQDSINQSMVVLSKVQETAVPDEEGQPTSKTAFGLVHPTDIDEDEPYLVLDNDANGDLDFDAWVDENGDICVAWVSYTDDALAAYNDALINGNAIDAMEAAGRNTEVKTVTVDVSENGNGKGTVKSVSGNTPNHGMYYMPSGAGDMIFYAEACYYSDTELTSLLDSYKAFYGETNYDKTSSGLYYGEDDPTANYQMTMKQMRAQVYGKSFYPTFAVPDSAGSGYTVSKVTAQNWIDDGVQIENASLAEVNGDYYAAYSTAQSALTQSGDEQTIKKLYLQKLTIGTDGDNAGKAVPSSAVALRKLVDCTNDNTYDGVYTSGGLSEQYRDPYFSNVQFLYGKLGTLVGEEENFDEQIQMQSYSLRAAAETFLIFEMNGNTYVVPNASLESITGENRGSIIPFFTRETAEELNKAGENSSNVEGSPVVTNVTFGADGNGNIAAVYTKGENGTPGNAVYLTKYDPQSQTWGLGTRLAMRDMDTIEEAEANGWSADETAAVWYDTNKDGKVDTEDEVSSFTFNRLRIGLADTDKLLVVTEGTLMALEAVEQQRATYDS